MFVNVIIRDNMNIQELIRSGKINGCNSSIKKNEK